MVETVRLTDMYMTVLETLSVSDRLDLIVRLSNSLREDATPKKIRPNLRTCFSGDWSDITADELRNHDYHGRTLEKW